MIYDYVFNAEACWYVDSCNKAFTEECSPGCVRYMEMHYLMMNGGIPEKRQRAAALTPTRQDVEAFKQLQKIKNEIVDFVTRGESVYIYSSNFGNGKTTWAIKLLTRWFDEIWAGNGFRCRGVFVHVPTLLTKLKNSFNVGKDLELENLKTKLVEADLVVWDDIASTKLTDFDHSNLLTFIDQRTLNQLSNIYTGNMGEAELVDALGNRLASRVWNNSRYRIEFVGADRRGIK